MKKSSWSYAPGRTPRAIGDVMLANATVCVSGSSSSVAKPQVPRAPASKRIFRSLTPSSRACTLMT